MNSYREVALAQVLAKLQSLWVCAVYLSLQSLLHTSTQGEEMMKRTCSHTVEKCQRIRLSMTQKAVEQIVPPRCAMQGPICGGPPS